MASIEKRRTDDGETRYRVLVRLKGAPAQSATFRRLTDAKRWAQQTEVAIREGRHFKTVEAKRHSLTELVERYLENLAHHRSASKRRDQERHLRWWSEQLGDLSLAEVTPATIAEKREQLARGQTVRKSKRSPATVNRYLASLSHAYSVAIREWGWVESNPVRKVSKLKEPRGRVRYLSETERQSLLAACQTSNDRRLYPLVVLALSTGARQGELLGLRWSHLKRDQSLAVLDETKNGERRSIPIVGYAATQLEKLGRVRRVDTDLVFSGADGRAVFPRRAWENALADAGLKDFRFHDLRHTAASYLAMNGATNGELAAVLGHKTLAMVKRYSHIGEQHTSEVVRRMNERIFPEAKS